MKVRMLRTLGWLAGAYAAVVVAARLGHKRLLYPAPRAGLPPLPEGASLLELQAADGVEVHAVLFAEASGGRTVVHFHGNGETIADNLPLAGELRRRRLGVMLVEYRGYGVSRGPTPSEDGLYLDASAALDALAQRGVDTAHTVLWGSSLGTGVAAEMASRGRAAALVLQAPYTSMPDVARRHVPIFPMRFVIPDRFDTLSKTARIRIPTLVVHGDRDEVVPYDMGQRVAAAIAGATLHTVYGGRHNDLFAIEGAPLLDIIAAHANR